ncbi:MAG: hypothetical protein FWG30_02785 [Eubacteriaceae bacterium]|nr:hypothetical protein [Eubacteriaceae bacterium]
MYYKKFGLKLRNSSPMQKQSAYSTRNARERFTINAAVCVLILSSILALKAYNTGSAALGSISKLVKKQTDFAQAADDIVGFFTTAYSNITGRDAAVSIDAISTFAPPLKQGVVEVSFVETAHPVFSTVVAPTGVKIAAPGEAFVYSPGYGTCENVIPSTNGAKRIVIALSKNTKVVYDNLAEAYIDAGDEMQEDQVIGMLAEGNSVLGLEVWVDNEAKDPLDYFEAIY